MSREVNTSTLMGRIMKTRSLSRFLTQNEQYMKTVNLSEYLKEQCAARGMSAAQAIGKAQIDRSYGYQIFKGIRRPSRDKLLQLALAMELDSESVQHLLAAGGKAPLYPRLKRDAVILYCIREAFSVGMVQETLEKYELSLLGEVED